MDGRPQFPPKAFLIYSALADIAENTTDASVIEKEVEENDVPKIEEVDGKAVENGKQEMLLAFPVRSGDLPTVDEEEEMKGR